jgi:hypothetical protein
MSEQPASASSQEQPQQSEPSDGAPRRRWPAYLFRTALVLGLLIFLAIVMTSPPDRGEQPGWTDAAEMLEPRGEGSAAVGVRESGCDNPPCEVIVVAGGFEPVFSTSRRVEGYVVDEDRWIELPDLPAPRHHPGAAALEDGTIVVTGGTDGLLGWDPEDTAWALAPDSDEWTTLDPLPEPRWGHRLLSMGDQLVLIGGHGGEDTLLWTIDDGWQRGAPIPEPRDHLGAVVVDDEIWVVGGRDDDIKHTVDLYHPEDDTWRDGPNLPDATSGAAIGLIDRWLILVAGEDDSVIGGGMVRNSWMLDVDEPKPGWIPMTEPPEDMHGAGDAVVGDGEDARLFVLGGAGRHGAFSPLSWSDRVMVLEDPQPREDYQIEAVDDDQEDDQ